MTVSTKPLPSVRLVLSENAFVDWILSAQPGDQIIYHRGILACDTAQASKRMVKHERFELSRVARRAMEAYEKGLVFLLQRRNGREDISYLAIARSPYAYSSLSQEQAHERV